MIIGADRGRATPCGSIATVNTRFHMMEIAALDHRDDALDSVVSMLGLAASPLPGHGTESAGLSLLYAAPSRWWLRTDAAPSLSHIPGLMLTDISDGLVCLRVEGATTRDWAAQYCPLDLRPRSFGPNHVAWTRFAEVRALLHCVGSDVLDIYLGASYADDVLDCCLTATVRA